MADIESNIYNIRAFGSQTWMMENLRTSHYCDETPIKAAKEDSTGIFYSYYTLSVDKLCPDGWHVPEDWEWQVLCHYMDHAGIDPAVIGTGFWWSATGYDSSEGWVWYKDAQNSLIYKYVENKSEYRSVRCVKND